MYTCAAKYLRTDGLFSQIKNKRTQIQIQNYNARNLTRSKSSTTPIHTISTQDSTRWPNKKWWLIPCSVPFESKDLSFLEETIDCNDQSMSVFTFVSYYDSIKSVTPETIWLDTYKNTTQKQQDQTNGNAQKISSIGLKA